MQAALFVLIHSLLVAPLTWQVDASAAAQQIRDSAGDATLILAGRCFAYRPVISLCSSTRLP